MTAERAALDIDFDAPGLHRLVGLLLAPRGVRTTPILRLATTRELSAIARAAVAHGVDWFVLSEVDNDPALHELAASTAFRSLRARSLREMADREQRLVAPLALALQALESVGVRACCLKGPMLAARLLGDARARDSNDLDLLIVPGDYPPAMAALTATGWRTSDSVTAPPAPGTRPHSTLSCGQTPLELHVTPGWDFGIDWPVSELMGRSRALDTGGCVLDPLDEFVWLAAHGLKHQFRRLQWQLDLALLARTIPSLALLEARSRELGTTHVQRCARHVLIATLGTFALPAGWTVAPCVRYDLARWLSGRQKPVDVNRPTLDLPGGIARKLLQLLLADGAGGNWRTARSIFARIRERLRWGRPAGG